MSSHARRRIIVVATVAVTLLTADGLVRYMKPVLRGYSVADYQRKPSVIAAGPMPEIILMGSSRAKYALVPRVFESLTGRRTYNLGIAGSKVVEWLMLSRQLFERERPRLVVLGINAGEVRLDYSPTEAARNLFSLDDFLESCARDGLSRDVIGAFFRRAAAPSWAVFDQRYEIGMWSQERLAWLLPKNAQHARELRRRVETPEPPDGYDHPWAHGRQMRNIEERLLNNVAGVEAASVPGFSADAPALKCLGQFLEELRRREIAVVVAYIPNCPRTEERWIDVEPRMIDQIEQICRASGVPFISCTHDEVQRTNRDFIEEVHVGLPLAETISRRAGRQILVCGLLKIGHDRLAGKMDETAPSHSEDAPD